MRKSLAIATVIGALALAGCAQPATPAPGTSTDAGDAVASVGDVTVAMVASACLPLYPTYVAQEMGYFAENGLTVEIQPVSGSASVLQAMISGQADIGNPGATPLIFSVEQGQEVKYIANTMPGGAFSLITPVSTGITDVQGLHGKIIGISTADGGEVAFVKSALQSAGLEEGDYELLVVGEGGQAIAGFTRGDIDAFAAAPDGVAILATSGLDVLTLPGTTVGHMFGNGLAANNALIEENPDAVEAFGQAYRRAVEYGTENPDQVLEICKKYQPQEVEDPAFAEAMLGAFNESQISPDGADFGYNNPEHWERIVDDLVAAGELEDGAVLTEDLFTSEFVDAFNK